MWFEDKIFWTTEEGELFMFDGLDTKVLDFVTDAACVAIDWLGEKIYWSVYKNGVVSIVTSQTLTGWGEILLVFIYL